MKVNKIVIFGASGMLGRYVSSFFKQEGAEVIGVTRESFEINLETNKSSTSNFLDSLDLGEGDVVINCVGLIKPQVDKYGEALSIAVNSLFPHLLAQCCEEHKVKMIHVSTDCVFSGKKGGYSEISPHDVSDTYGRTKSLGEPKNCSVIRTSIIGEEVGQSRSLVEWVKSNKSGEINGFSNHKWNGVTCLQLAKTISEIIKTDSYWGGVRHIHSNTLNKFELLGAINRIYGLNITITEKEDANYCDRTMSSVFNPVFSLPSLEQQIIDMKEYSSTLEGV